MKRAYLLVFAVSSIFVCALRGQDAAKPNQDAAGLLARLHAADAGSALDPVKGMEVLQAGLHRLVLSFSHAHPLAMLAGLRGYQSFRCSSELASCARARQTSGTHLCPAVSKKHRG